MTGVGSKPSRLRRPLTVLLLLVCAMTLPIAVGCDAESVDTALGDLGLVTSGPFADNNGLTPPKSWQGKPFRLSHDYPTSLPPKQDTWSSSITWPMTNENVVDYLMALRKAVYDDLLPVNWRADELETGPNGEGGWYHAPWLGETVKRPMMADALKTWPGRDYAHGTYFSTPLPMGTLPAQKAAYANYEIVLYNDRGGFYFHELWKDGEPNFKKLQMPQGTVVTKLVFTTAPAEGVLEGTEVWDVFLKQNPDEAAAFQKVSLIQIDICVKDHEHSPETGWIFSTYVYDKDAPGETPYDKMVPLGAQWGNDPGVMPGFPLKETAINPNSPPWHKNNLGFGGRLSGPIDGARGVGSCMGCHASAEFSLKPDAPVEAPNRMMMMPPEQGPIPRDRWNEAMRIWFRNLDGDEAFSTGKKNTDPDSWVATDYSFVTLGSLANYYTKKGVKTGENVFLERPRHHGHQ